MEDLNLENKFKILLNTIKEINDAMLEQRIVLTTSIAFGYFKYTRKIEFSGTIKNPIYGYGYLNAFIDSEYGKPKIQPGQCRIVEENFPPSIN